MTNRSKIQQALAASIKAKLNGAPPYTTNLYNKNVDTRLKFWDEVNDFPYICITAGGESREYLPGNFKWGRITYTLRVYVNGEYPEEELEAVMADVETAIDSNFNLQYDEFNPSISTEDIRILSLSTDEGALAPYGVGEIIIEVLYQKP